MEVPPLALVRGGRKLPLHLTDEAKHIALYGQNADAPHIFGGIFSTTNGKQMMTMDFFERNGFDRNGKGGCRRVTFGFVSRNPDGMVTIQAIIDDEGLKVEVVPLCAVVWGSIEVFAAAENSTNVVNMASLLTKFIEEQQREFQATRDDVKKVSTVRLFLQCAVFLTQLKLILHQIQGPLTIVGTVPSGEGSTDEKGQI